MPQTKAVEHPRQPQLKLGSLASTILCGWMMCIVNAAGRRRQPSFSYIMWLKLDNLGLIIVNLGLLKVRVVPPRKLYLPVLPTRVPGGKCL